MAERPETCGCDESIALRKELRETYDWILEQYLDNGEVTPAFVFQVRARVHAMDKKEE